MVPLIRDVSAAFPGARIVVMAPYPSAQLMFIALRLGAVNCIATTTEAAPVLAAFAEAESPVDLAPPARSTFATLDEARWHHIGRALEASRGNISGAARLLGIHRQSLQRILRSLREDGAANSNEDPPTLEDAAS
jgi:two-component system, response regulator RegA